MFDFRVTHHCVDRIRKQIHRVGDLRLIAQAVTGQVERDHSVPFGEFRDLIAPVVEIAGPAMNQDQRITAFAVTLVMNTCAVELRVFRLTVGGERRGRCEAERY